MTLAEHAAPEISVVIPTDRWETVATVVERLERQSAGLEVVLVTDATGPLETAVRAHGVSGFVRVVDAGTSPLSFSHWRGVAAARTPIVFLGETHSYAGAEFAARLVVAHRESDVVVPCFGNANPSTALSWAGFLQDYGDCADGRAPGVPEVWPGYNVSYRRSVLEAFGERLDAVLQAGDELRDGIRRQGGTVAFAPDIRVAHVNVDRPWPWVHERVLRGQLIAAARRGPWTWARRLAYAAAAPLIALVLMRRNWPAFAAALRAGRLPAGTAAAWVAGFLLRTAGEAVGYVGGASARTALAMEEYELHKVAYTRPGR